MSARLSPSYRKIYAAVSRIPRGRVATYGQIARRAGMPGQARLVGYALNALSEGTAVPWQRVVNAKGLISPRSDGSGHERLQRVILEREGVRFGPLGAIPLREFQWRPGGDAESFETARESARRRRRSCRPQESCITAGRRKRKGPAETDRARESRPSSADHGR